MEALAIISHLFRYAVAITAVCFCIVLYRRSRFRGWLLLSAAFLDPFYLLLARALHGRPMLAYQTVSSGPDGALHVTYQMEFPFLSIVATFGLFLIFQRSRPRSEDHHLALRPSSPTDGARSDP